jgi:signal peptidase I
MSPSTACVTARIESAKSPSPRGTAASNQIADKIRANGSVCFRVFGASMFPWIRSGDLAFARSFGYEQAARGDVVLYERDERIFVHRVIRRATADTSLVTKGDSLDREDEPVSRGEFLGRVIRIHRDSRHIDIESLGWVLAGRLLARISSASSIVYRPGRALKHLFVG